LVAQRPRLRPGVIHLRKLTQERVVTKAIALTLTETQPTTPFDREAVPRAGE